jgi:hypothetical protein
MAPAGRTAPTVDKVGGGRMSRGYDALGGGAVDEPLPLPRTTDNGHLIVYATPSAPEGARCGLAVESAGHTLAGGVNPQGGLLTVAGTPSVAGARAGTDRWVTSVDPVS